jgi:hypothetical protein
MYDGQNKLEGGIDMSEIKFFLTYDESEDDITLKGKIEKYIEENGVCEAKKVIIGAWQEPFDCDPEDVVQYLYENKEKFPNVEEIYVGDMDSEECEVSWIIQTDLTRLLTAFPLKTLTIKGSQSLRLENAASDTLEKLVIISGGLETATLEDISSATFPNLSHLELYLGVSDYGFDGDIEVVKPFMSREKFPKLKFLGLKNSEIQDEICEEILKSDMIDGLDVLDMSLGTFSDKGAEQVLKNIEKLSKLQKLDLTFNYASDEMLQKLEDAFKETNVEVLVDRDDADYYEDEDWRYPYITE